MSAKRMNEDNTTSRNRFARGLIILAWIACIAELPLDFFGFMGAAMGPTAFRPSAENVLLFLLAPVIAVVVLGGTFVCEKPSGWRIMAILLPGTLSLGEIGLFVWMWKTF